MGEFIIAAADAFGLGHPHVVAPGIGTAAALFAAARHPGRLRSLVVGSGAAAVPLQLGGMVKDIIEAPDLDGFRRADPRQLVTDLEVFFPGRGEPAEPARRICASCPVRQPCLDYAISHGIVHGIWGGLAERDRRTLRSRHAGAARRERDEAIAAAAAAGYTKAAMSRAFVLAATSVTRGLSRDAGRRRS